MKRAYELAGMDYYPQVYPGKVVLFRRRGNITKLQLQRQHGWTGLASAGLEIIEVPGDHDTLMVEPNVRVLARELTEWLANYAEERAGDQRAFETTTR
jgi:thioesterase domain-containing protein